MNDIFLNALEESQNEFGRDEVRDVCAEVPGVADTYSWWWVLRLTRKRYALVTVFEKEEDEWGGYQTSLKVVGIFNTARQAAEDAPLVEDLSNRAIRSALLSQLRKETVVGTYFGKTFYVSITYDNKEWR